jgi:hypothetical protein
MQNIAKYVFAMIASWVGTNSCYIRLDIIMDMYVGSSLLFCFCSRSNGDDFYNNNNNLVQFWIHGW